MRNMRRHIRLHAYVRPYTCNLCQLKFKLYSNLMKHFKTNRHLCKNDTNERTWTVDMQAYEEQSKTKEYENMIKSFLYKYFLDKLLSHMLIIDNKNQIDECKNFA